jgi:hypothetical protein
MTKIFYFLVGLAASSALGLVFYFVLRLDSSIAELSSNTSQAYFWSYLGLTIGTVTLFGVNVALFTYRIRRYGFPKINNQLSAGFGSLLGIAASACPVCGSTLLSALGIAGGLGAFPFAGLEIKAASFVLMVVPIWLTAREIKGFECGTKACPQPRDASFNESDWAWLILILGLIIGLFLIGIKKAESDSTASYFCQGQIAQRN